VARLASAPSCVHVALSTTAHGDKACHLHVQLASQTQLQALGPTSVPAAQRMCESQLPEPAVIPKAMSFLEFTPTISDLSGLRVRNESQYATGWYLKVHNLGGVTAVRVWRKTEGNEVPHEARAARCRPPERRRLFVEARQT
jgi:hypothetical protein